MKYFSWDAEGGFELHETEEEARKAASESLEIARDSAGAPDSGWPEHTWHSGWPEHTWQICWGELRQECVESDAGPADSPPWPEGSRFLAFDLNDIESGE